MAHAAGKRRQCHATAAPSATEAHAAEMLDVFKRFKRDNVEREVPLSSGWVAVYKKRKKGDAGDVTLTKPGEVPLRSALDVRRKLGLPFDGPLRSSGGDEED